jgi:hypothetical protein
MGDGWNEMRGCLQEKCSRRRIRRWTRGGGSLLL